MSTTTKSNARDDDEPSTGLQSPDAKSKAKSKAPREAMGFGMYRDPETGEIFGEPTP